MRTEDLRSFSDTVDAIYEAALKPERWPSAVGSIAALHGSDKALLFTPALAPQLGGFVFPHGIGQQAIEEWAARYIEHDLWTQAGIARGLPADGTALIDTDLVPDAVFESSLFYREFLSRLGIGRLATGWVFNGTVPGLPATACAVYRPRAAPPFDNASRELHGLTLNHLSRALGTMMRLRDHELRLASTLQALDRLPGAIVLHAFRGNVAYLNRSARNLLSANDGLSLAAGNPLVDLEGWIEVWDRQAQDRLTKDFKSTIAGDAKAAHFSRGIKVPRPSGKPDYIVRTSVLPQDNEFDNSTLHARAIAFITDPAAVPRLDQGLLKSLYGLSAAEVRVAQALLSGEGLPTIGAQLALSENTVKKHLQSIFEKTGTRRQAQVVKLLMGLASI